MESATLDRLASGTLEERSQFLVGILDGSIVPPPVDGAKINARITEQMLKAETPEEALKAGATASFEDGLLGVPLEVRDLIFRKSTLEGDIPVYALIDATRLDTGDDLIVTCSAGQVLRTLGTFKVRDWLPTAFVVRKAENKTAGGYTQYVIDPA